MYHLGMNNSPVGGRSSETWSHLIDMNNNNQNNTRWITELDSWKAGEEIYSPPHLLFGAGLAQAV
jgi:hypothetical protein